MVKYRNHTVQEYLNALAKKEPTPGGGSAAALTAATGAALISMVAQYSKGKSKSKATEKRIASILKQSEAMRKRLIALIDLDAEVYLKVVKARGKKPAIVKKAERQAAKVPGEVAKICYKLTQLTPFLVEKGNQYLLSDIVVAVDLLFASYNASKVTMEASS